MGMERETGLEVDGRENGNDGDKGGEGLRSDSGEGGSIRLGGERVRWESIGKSALMWIEGLKSDWGKGGFIGLGGLRLK